MFHDGCDDAGAASSLESGRAGEDFIEHAAEGKYIASRIGLLAFELLGRHVLQSAENRPFLSDRSGDRLLHGRGCRGSGRFGKAEIEQLDTALRDQDIGGLEIAMNDADAVRGIQGLSDFGRIAHRCFEGKRALHGMALDVLHYEIVGADVEERTDVRMVQCGDRAGLALETLVETFLRNLDGNATVETGIAGLPDLAHSALAEKRKKFIWTELFT